MASKEHGDGVDNVGYAVNEEETAPEAPKERREVKKKRVN